MENNGVTATYTFSAFVSHCVNTSPSVFQSQFETAGVVAWIMNYTQLHLFSVVKYFSQRSTMRVNLIEALIDNNLISGRTAWIRISFTETNSWLVSLIFVALWWINKAEHGYFILISYWFMKQVNNKEGLPHALCTSCSGLTLVVR